MPPRADKGSGAAGKAGEGSGEFAGPFTFNGHIPSTTDLKFIFAFVNHFKVKPEMNWEELTEDLGLKGKKSTYERWRLFRQKFGITLPEESANGPKKFTATTTTTPAARGSGNTNDSEDEGAPTVATPAKRSSAKAVSTAGTPRTPGSAAGKKRAAAASAAASASSPTAGTPTKKVKGSAGAGVGGSGSPAAASKGKGVVIPPTPQNNGEPSPSPLSSPASDYSTTQMAE
ncbi:uncharacterized protein THITE_2132879 [Thermothielavioides terrestris NRRL 8126]|uniref:Uncharacterized protein n=1 Tax=Thermothielavioides terrestris (strain ATCC 38088 / NRRL 8126) TaxID=578455 RepID=G2RI91_THETT|nr:uncharacterized protein THITE_2132879 [Thermothielavioides terrestris NRRL 8126]AEO71553.1 hypothetical protein THITE_2132879 [Thermothielavioides terrestris NRRL 8126]